MTTKTIMHIACKALLLCFFAIVQFVPCKLYAQTTLSTGDVSLVGWNSSTTPDGFAFVTWVPLTSGTVIKFTNNAFLSSSSATTASNARVQQQIIYWTATSAISAGTVITIDASTSPTASTGTVSYSSQSQGTSLALSNTGGRIFIYQGSSDYVSAPTSTGTFLGTILYGLNYQGATGSSIWLTSGSASSTQSYLPSELSSSTLNLTFGGNANSGQYTGSRSSQSSFASYKTMVQNTSNWTTTTGTGTTTFSTTAFTLASSDYYYKGTGAITTLSNWGSNTDGTGTAPVSFTTTGSTYYVANTSGTVNLSANWTVGSSTGTLNIGSGIVLGINGNTLDVTGAIAGTGTLAGSSTSNLTLTGTVGTLNFTTGTSNRTLHNLTLNASTTATLGTAITITGGSSYGVVTVGSSSTLTTGGNLTLGSDANGTAAIANSSGSISGNVTIQRYIPGGRRAFRFFAHPFSSAQALTSLTDDIDITGSGGATNGFTATTTNNPSAFWYDITAGNGSSVNDPGWTAFTNTNGASTNSWDQYEGIRVLVRGSKGEGLTGAAYTPSAVTIDATGAVNQGNQVVTCTKGSGTDYIFIGNPYPSEINLNVCTRASNIGSSFYVWNPSSGTRGAYVTNLFSSTYYLPSFSGFFVQASANTNNTITFHESDKSTNGASGTVFKPTGATNSVLFRVYSNNDSITWDQFQLDFNDNAVADSEWYDAPKLFNPDLSIYSFSQDGKMLAIDTRPYSDSSVIPLGVSYAPLRSYKLRIDELDMPQGTSLYLHDKYLNTTTLLTKGAEYLFDVTSDSLTQGDKRFELQTLGKPTGVSEIGNNGNRFDVQLIPNPATDVVKVVCNTIANSGAKLVVRDITGAVVYTKHMSKPEDIIDVSGFAHGVYLIELCNASGERIVRRLVKE